MAAKLEAARKGATSLIDIILRKWGDDAEGAAKELEEMVGFPESVANRIATGELPMDEASRVARRDARYADEGLVHVNRGGIKGEGFDNSRLPTDDPDTPFNAHWFTTDPHPATAYRKQNSDDPLTYTPAVLEKGRRGDWRDVVNYGESMGDDLGYGTQFREGLLDTGVSDIVVRGGDKIDQSTIDALPVGGRLKVDPDNKYGDRRNSLVKNDDGSLGFYEGSEHILDYDDLADYQRFNPEIKDVAVLDNTIIRSPNAAFDPQYKGSNIMGGAAGTAGLAGLLAAGQSEESEAGFITKGGKTLLEAFHGSPHKFDKFSMDSIGTGEGAQAYGHGLYFADSEDLARGYRERLTKDGKDIVDIRLKKAGGDIDKAIADTEAMAEKYRQGGALSYAESNEEDLRFLRQFKETGQVDDGALYRTEIDVTPESLLDWDKPLSEQPQAVKDLAYEYGYEPQEYTGDEVLGSKIYEAMTFDADRGGSNVVRIGVDADQMPEGQEAASALLSDRGIKGIKYLDGDSRHPTQAEADIANEIRELEKKREIAGFMSGTPDVPDLSDSIKSLNGDIASRRQALKEMEDARQTSNYVIFDDSLINIAERGNADPRLLAGTAAGTAGLLASGQSEESDASVASLARMGLRLVDGRSPAATQSDHLFNIVDDQGSAIGGAEFYVTPDGDLSAYGMRMNTDHRGNGIMNEAYDAVEEVTGRKIEPSDVLTGDGLKFWIRRDPYKIREMYDDGLLDDYDREVFDSLFEEALKGSNTMGDMSLPAAQERGLMFVHGATKKPKVTRKR